MKKLFIGIIIIMCVTTVAILTASGVMGFLEEDGFAVPASAGIMQAQSGEAKPIELTAVHYEDEVYETLTGYYVGPDRVRIDMIYPLYVRGGTGLRFLTDNVWLITTDVALYQSFEGMYLSEGITYNVDMTQADEEEFILASLSNGLYMNAQQALFEGQLGDIVIPVNSILFLSEDSIGWYQYNNGTLEYVSEQAVFGAYLSIGEHRYAYVDLLRALGLVQDALEEGDGNRPDQGLLGEAEEILMEIPEEEPAVGGVEDLADEETEGHHDDELETGGEESREAEESEGEESDEDSEEESEEESAGLGDELDNTEHPAGGDQGHTQPDGSGDEDQGDDTQGSTSSNGDKSDNGGDILPGGDPGDHPEDDDVEDGGDEDKSDDNEGDHDHEGESSGSGGTPGTDTDTDAGDGEEGEKDPDAPKPSKPPTQDGGGEGDTEGDNTENADPGDGGGDEVGENEPAPYREPEVTIRDIELWSYAMSVDMVVDDISGAILRGVSFAVYKSIDPVGLGGDSWTDVHGHTIYASEDYTGKSTMLRRSRSGSQTFALSTLEPGQTVYVQYSYRYNHVEIVPGVDEEGNAIEVTRTTRRQFYSNFIELKVPTVEEGQVKAVAADWSVDFAAHDTAVGLSGLTIANTSDYDASIVAYDFVNFKKNTLPYVNRLEMYVTPLDEKGQPDGEAQRITISSSVLNRAQKEANGTDFDSSAPELLPNREYSYTVVAKDRWGHEIPLVANGVDSTQFSGTFYTSKSAPEVKITEVDNITDELTIKVTVSDPTSSLVPGEPLYLKVADRSGEAAYLDGKWNTNKISPGGEDVYVLELKDPKDGAEYELMLNSLFFGTLYNIQVLGDYDPQPDVADAPATLPVATDVQLGRLSVFTASLSKNPIYFSTSVTDLLDTSATLNMTMTKDTALEMLPLVDEFHIILKDEHGNEVSRTILTQEDLMYEQYTYESPYLTLEEGSATQPKVLLYGTDELYRGNAWDSLCVGYVPSGDESGSMTLSQPMQLRVIMPKDSLVHFTDYTFSIEALVKKSGKTDQIPVSMTTNSFTTKKTIPEIRYSELFLAADVAEFLDLRIFDPDTTILNNGLVNVYLYYGSTLLSAQQITAQKQDSGEGVDLRFEGIIEGGEYELRFVASAYNDAEGYGSYRANYELQSYEFVGGSALSGTLNLEDLGNGGRNLVNNIDTATDYINGYLSTDKKIYGYGNSSYRTYYIPVEENTEYYVQIPKDSWMTRIGCGNIDPATITKGGMLMSNCGSSQQIDGNRSFTYTTGEGASWLYISVASVTDARVAYGLRVVKNSEKVNTDGFRADISVKVHDYFGYLGEEGEKSEVYLSLERSESINELDYRPYGEDYVLPLEKVTLEDGQQILQLDITQVITGLASNSAWRATLTARYKGSEVTLDEITFQTDGDYVSVSTHRELYEAQRANAYANILVTSDFEQNVNGYVNFYGTVDFQGHKVTRAKSGISTYFLSPYQGSTIRNLVYEYPKELYYVNPCTIFPGIYGTVENLIVQTQGQVEVTSSWKSLVANTIYPTGVLRNFVVKISDDVILTTEENMNLGVLVTGNYGLIENGYMYGSGGAGVIFRNITNSSGTIGVTYYNGVTRHIYLICDSWYQSSGSLLCANSRGGENFSGVYAVGDYYSVNAGETNNYRSPLTTCRMLPTSPTVSGYQNIWALTSLGYTTPAVTKLASVAQLYDVAWQQEVLGSGFDVETSVSMGFYPRLNLPKEMQVHQEYLSLPALGQENLPSIISDDWGTGEVYGQHDLDSGYIVLRFKNDNRYDFESITIEGLICSIQTEGATNDGFYEVILSVEVDSTEPEYLSSYKVVDFSYKVGNVVRTTKSDYSTRNIEFWKAVRTATDWAAINDHMDWNYKLVSDIKFDTAGALPRQIVINGTQADYTSTGSRAYFKGKIDGQEYALQNINLSNLANPYVFYYLSGAEIRNLFVENLTLTGSESAGSYCGFIGYATSSKVENVRIRNAYVAGGGYLGILSGYMTNSLLTNCSVTDSTLTDLDRGRELYAGGICGYFNTGRFYSNYTRNVNISINDTTVVMAIGGLTGYTGANAIDSCYAHGSISTNASYVGGLNGQVTVGDGTYVNRSWSYVDIFQSAGNNVGGITAHNRSRVDYCMSLGNIAGAGSATNRIKGYGSGTTSTSYAYAGQIVSGLGSDNKGDAGGLLDGETLGRKVTWQDTIQLGNAWDYSPVERGCAPLLAMDCSRSGWTQQDVPLPGQAGDPVLQVTAASYLRSGDVESYIVQARLEHPNMESSTLQAMYASTPKALEIELKGMDLTDSAQSADRPENERTVVILQQDGDNPEATIIQITTHGFLSALDSYPLTIRYKQDSVERELSAMVEYLEVEGNPHRNYWEIRNISDWNYYIPKYGFNGENFRILGTVDFAGAGGVGGDTEYKGLIFNRLEGTVTTDESGNSTMTGFKNLAYNGMDKGLPWIEKVAISLKDLSFENMSFTFSSTGTTRVMTGAIISTSDVSNLRLVNIKMSANQYSRGYFGFISNHNGILDGVYMENIELTEFNNAGSNSNYTGALVAKNNSEIRNVEAHNITVNRPKNSYVGAVAGYAGTYGTDFTGISVENFTVIGSTYVGGLAGQAYNNTADNNSATGAVDPTTKQVTGRSTVTGSNAVGGLYGAVSMYERDENGWHIENVDVKATSTSSSYVGAVAASASHIRVADVKIINCTVEGYGHVGGMIGTATNGWRRLLDVEIIDTKVSNLSNSQILGTSSTTGVSAGGLLGRSETSQTVDIQGVVISGCTISGPAYVGGLTGNWIRDVSGGTISRVYVDEGTSVTASGSCAGGLMGYTNVLTISDCACGATVTAGNEAAGGLVGQLEPFGEYLSVSLKYSYYRGKVSAGLDYAGGVIGRLNSGHLKLSTGEVVNVVVAADIRTAGSNASFWVNDTTVVGDAGVGSIYVMEESVLNGQTARAITDAGIRSGATTYVVPIMEDVELLRSAEVLNTKSFWESLSFNRSYSYTLDSVKYNLYYWNLEHIGQEDNLYMPYTTTYNKNVEDPDQVYASVIGGIRLMDPMTVSGQTKVYASGVDSVNIEKPLPEGATTASVTIQAVGGEEEVYATDSNGILSLNYDFKTDFYVDGTLYRASDLARRVMTYGNGSDNAAWYYLDSDGYIHYGYGNRKAADMQELVGMSDFKAVHLWQGYAMVAESGSVNTYALQVVAGKLSAVLHQSTAENLTPLMLLGSPLSRAIYSSDGPRVYHDFSLSSGVPVPYRVFYLGGSSGTPVFLSPAQGLVYDGVFLTEKTSFGQTSRWFAALGTNGVIQNYLTELDLSKLSKGNEGIDHISNSLGFDGTALLVCYEDGSVEGIDVTTGTKICPSSSASESGFFSYALRSVASLFSADGGPGVLSPEGSYLDGLQEQFALEQGVSEDRPEGATPENGQGQDGSVVADGDGGAESKDIEEAEGGEQLPADGADVDGLSTMDGEAVGGGIEVIAGDTMADGSTQVQGETTAAEGDGEAAVSAADAAGGAGGAAGTAAVYGSGTESGGGAGAGYVSSTGGVSGGGTGSVPNGGESGGTEASQGQARGGGTAENAAQTGTPEGERGLGAEGERSEEELLRELFGDSVVLYSEDSGQYELMETASMLDRQPRTMAEAMAEGTSQPADTPEEDEDGFSIAWGLNRHLDSSEKQGFTLLTAAAIVAAAVLVVLYFTVVRKRKETKRKGKHE